MLNKRYDIYLGCNNKYDNSNENLSTFTTKIVETILSNYEMGFSITKQLGGYIHQDGTYILEDSIKISVIGDIESHIVDEFISDLKKFFEQETILVSIEQVKTEYR